MCGNDTSYTSPVLFLYSVQVDTDRLLPLYYFISASSFVDVFSFLVFVCLFVFVLFTTLVSEDRKRFYHVHPLSRSETAPCLHFIC